MTTMDCSALQESACELALGLLMGTERAAAISHLERCGDCRREVATLADAADLVLLLTPPCEPPAGFEARVMAQLEAESGRTPAAVTRAPRRRARRPRRRATALVAAVAAVVLAILLFRPEAGDDHVAAAEMRTAAGQTIGHAFVVDGGQRFVILDMPAWDELAEIYGASRDDPYWLDVERRDGSLAHIRIDADRPSPWRVVIDRGDDIVGVSIVDRDGRVWCSGRLED